MAGFPRVRVRRGGQADPPTYPLGPPPPSPRAPSVRVMSPRGGDYEFAVPARLTDELVTTTRGHAAARTGFVRRKGGGAFLRLSARKVCGHKRTSAATRCCSSPSYWHFNVQARAAACQRQGAGRLLLSGV